VRLEGVWFGGRSSRSAGSAPAGKSGAQSRRIESPGRREEKNSGDTGCPHYLSLLAEMRSAQMEAMTLCQEALARVRSGGAAPISDKRVNKAYERWNAVFDALREHIKLHPRIPPVGSGSA
jgi:hypothetical protein